MDCFRADKRAAGVACTSSRRSMFARRQGTHDLSSLFSSSSCCSLRDESNYVRGETDTSTQWSDDMFIPAGTELKILVIIIIIITE